MHNQDSHYQKRHLSSLESLNYVDKWLYRQEITFYYEHNQVRKSTFKFFELISIHR